MQTSLVRANFPLLILVGAVLVSSLGVLIWRSWRSDQSTAAEQTALLLVALNAILPPTITAAVAWVFHPTLGEVLATTLLSTVLALVLLSRGHRAVLGREGLYRRVQGLVIYYAYLFFLLTQFPQIHAVLTILLGEASRAHGVLLIALFLPAFAGLIMARPAREEWGKWWPIRQWSVLFLIGLLTLWMSRHWPS